MWRSYEFHKYFLQTLECAKRDEPIVKSYFISMIAQKRYNIDAKTYSIHSPLLVEFHEFAKYSSLIATKITVVAPTTNIRDGNKRLEKN